jgi:hypothetical protein
MRWVGHVARTGERRGAYNVLVGRPEERNKLEDKGGKGGKILKWILMKWDGAWSGLNTVKNLPVP